MPGETPSGTDFERLLRTLGDARVEYIIIGGLAANAHGAIRLTRDVDIVYARTPDNVARLVAALAPLDPYLRGAPPGLPFVLDADTIRRGLNFTLTTSAGSIDLLGEVTGGGTFVDLEPHTRVLELFGIACRCVTLDKLIALKRAAGRPKDLESIAELEALREEVAGQ